MASARLVLDARVGTRARVRVWRADGPVDVDPRPAAHGGVELSWIVDGRVSYSIGRSRFDVGAGEAIVVPSQSEHATSFPCAMRGAAIWVDGDVVAEIADAIGRDAGLRAGKLTVGARTAALGAVLVDELKHPEAGSLLAADAIIEAMIVGALRDGREDGRAVPRDPAIATAVRRIEECYAEPLSVDDLARAAGMSRFHFSRRFRDATGRSPYRYLCDVRLERAAELLRRGRHGVTEAALSVGMSDPGRFARMFRVRFGATPSAFRAASVA